MASNPEQPPMDIQWDPNGYVKARTLGIALQRMEDDGPVTGVGLCMIVEHPILQMMGAGPLNVGFPMPVEVAEGLIEQLREGVALAKVGMDTGL